MSFYTAYEAVRPCEATRRGCSLLMISNSQQIKLLLCKYVSAEVSFWPGCIVETIPLNSVSRIDDEQVVAIIFCFLLKMLGERNVVTPVAAERRLFEMSCKPAVDVRRV